MRAPLTSTFTAVAMSSLLLACGKPAPTQEPVRAVKVITVGVSETDGQTPYAGEVRAQVESRLGFRVAGKLIRRHVELGQRVRAGQLLAEMDPQDYKLAVDAVRAQVQAATTNRDLAAADFKRYKELRDKDFISGAELERRETALKSAQAQLDAAQAQLASQGNQLAYSRLLADHAGVITGLDADAGQVVAAGTPVVRLAQDGPREVVFAIPEDKLATVKVGQLAHVKLWASDQQVQARVRDIAGSADPVTRTFTVKLALAEKDAPALGSTVTVLIQRGKDLPTQAIQLPTSALRQEGGQTAVWVLDTASMTVKSQVVQIATANGNEAVVAAGLQAGQQVVVAGVHVLSPGQKVTLYQARSNAPVSTAPASAAAQPAQ